MSSHRNDERRVVVTGLGVVSSIGIGWQEFWKNLIAGKSGISKVSSFDTSDYDRHYGGEVKNFDPSQFISKHRINKLGRTSQMAIAASKLALADAGFPSRKRIKESIAVCVGTTGGERRLIEICNEMRNKNAIHPASALFRHRLIACITANLASSIGEELALKGYCNTISTACSAGNYAIGEGFDLIRNARYDCALVGGVDGFSKMVFAGFSRLYDVAPEKCQPFDVNRQGTIPAEGAGMLLLESLERALKRKAHIYAEILGYGLSCDAYHMTRPSIPGIVSAIRKALKNSGVGLGDVDYISAHGTATIENDSAECRAISEVFGEYAKKIFLSSIKSMLGHAMGAASAIAAVACCKVIQEGLVPPTINASTLDPQCKNVACIQTYVRKCNIKIALSNGFAFGGNNASVVMQKNIG